MVLASFLQHPLLGWGAETGVGPDSELGRKSGASLRQNKESGKSETEGVSAAFHPPAGGRLRGQPP